jgi:hypothetical protein
MYFVFTLTIFNAAFAHKNVSVVCIAPCMNDFSSFNKIGDSMKQNSHNGALSGRRKYKTPLDDYCSKYEEARTNLREAQEYQSKYEKPKWSCSTLNKERSSPKCNSAALRIAPQIATECSKKSLSKSKSS